MLKISQDFWKAKVEKIILLPYSPYLYILQKPHMYEKSIS